MDRKTVLLSLTFLLVTSNLLVAIAPTLTAVLIGRVLLGAVLGAFGRNDDAPRVRGHCQVALGFPSSGRPATRFHELAKEIIDKRKLLRKSRAVLRRHCVKSDVAGLHEAGGGGVAEDPVSFSAL
jgi:hypothetical protein